MKKLMAVCLTIWSSVQISSAQILISPQTQELIDAALANSTTLQNNELTTEKERLEEKSIWNKYIPTVSATGLYGYTNHDLNVDLPTHMIPIINSPIFQSDQTFNNNAQALHGGVMAKAVLFSGGQIMNGAKAQEFKNQGNAYLREADKDAVIMTIMTSLDQWRLLQEAKLLIQQSEERLEKEKLRVEKAIENGLAIPYDREKINLAILELTSQKNDLENKEHLLLMKLAHDTGWTIEQLQTIQHDLDPIYITQHLLVGDKFELEALNSYKKANDFLIKKEKGSLLPTVGAVAGYSYSSVFNINSQTHLSQTNQNLDLNVNHLNLNNSFVVIVVMKWEIFNGFERSHKIKSAEISAQQLDNKLDETKELLDLQLEKNKVNYRHATEQISVAQQRVIIAENNLNTATKQYAAGLISITERLAAETDVYKQQLNLLETIMQQRLAALQTYQSAQSLSTFISTK